MSEQLGLTGDANLTKGDEVYLSRGGRHSLSKVAEVDSDSFFAVVGGRQGVFRESTNDLWQQDTDPGFNVSAVQDPLYAARLTLDGDEFEKCEPGSVGACR